VVVVVVVTLVVVATVVQVVDALVVEAAGFVVVVVGVGCGFGVVGTGVLDTFTATSQRLRYILFGPSR
jgi:hypothetical protein